MFCNICSRFSSLGADADKSIHVVASWTTNGVSYNGDSREQHMRSLRNKVIGHHDSISHNVCVKKLSKRSEELLPEAVYKSQSHLKGATMRIFRTAYHVAKLNRPYTDHFPLVQLQQENGIDMGKTLHSRWSSNNIIQHISSQMKKKLSEKIIANNCKISLLMDESTTISRKSTLIVYVRTSLFNCDASSADAFAYPLELVELSSLSSSHIVDSLYGVLDKHGFNEAFLSSNLIGLCSDGASNMVGRKSGVLTTINKKYPNTLIWHCMCHRVELAVGDSVDKINAVNHVKLFLDRLYSLYSQSPSAQRELEDVASPLGVELKKIGRVLDTRWAASSYRSLSAVWGNYKALYAHFTASSTNSSKTSTQRASFKGLANTLSSKQFVVGLSILTDALDEVSNLSLALQRDAIQLDIAYKIMERTIRALKQQKEGSLGDCYKELAESGFEVLKGVELHDELRAPMLNKKEFLQALIDNLSSRLECTVASNRRSAGPDDSKEMLLDLVEELKVLDPDTWPPELTSPWDEGEVKMASLCPKLGMPFTREIKSAFRDFIDDPSAGNPLMSRVKSAISTLPVSSADCERGFSTMNIVCTKSRNKLLVPNISSLMFISLVGPPITLFNPELYVKTWLSSHRGANSNQSRKASAPDPENSRYAAVWKFV